MSLERGAQSVSGVTCGKLPRSLCLGVKLGCEDFPINDAMPVTALDAMVLT